MTLNKISKKGFTVIEFLLVIVVVSLLSSLIFITASDSQKKSRDLERAEDVKQISAKMEQYYATYAQYPAIGSNDGQGSTFADNSAIVSAICSAVGPFSGLSPEATKSPKDKEGCSVVFDDNLSPTKDSDKYIVTSTNPGKDFTISYWEENKKEVKTSSSLNQ